MAFYIISAHLPSKTFETDLGGYNFPSLESVRQHLFPQVLLMLPESSLVKVLSCKQLGTEQQPWFLQPDPSHISTCIVGNKKMPPISLLVENYSVLCVINLFPRYKCE